MALLESPLKEQVAQLEEKGFQFYLKGNYEGYQEALLDAWKLLPEPKELWDESFSISKNILENYLVMELPSEAQKWVETVLKADPERQSDGERELYAGMVAYELGEFEKAMGFFEVVQKDSGGRLWKRSNVMKYFKFYKEKK